MPKALLVYPAFPPSYWSFQYALPAIGRKSSMPPLGLLTLAALFPSSYEVRIADMNVGPLKIEDIRWADTVFASTMVVQKESLYEVVRLANTYGKPVICGGPHPTSYHEDIRAEARGTIDHFFCGEAEGRFADFLTQFEQGKAPEVYEQPKLPNGKAMRPDIHQSPCPRYNLIPIQEYASMAIQFSRGCPFDCEFCDITTLFGRVPRTKTPAQILAELDMLYQYGWRGSVFFVDDNFIGNKQRALEVLPHIQAWQEKHGWPFTFFTEASANLASLPELVHAMVRANFTMVFIGIESTDPEVLLKTDKVQNVQKGGVEGYNQHFLLEAIRTLQRSGLEVSAGFIVGLDGELHGFLEEQASFIREAGIPMAMPGLLTALKGTNLYNRLLFEKRLLAESTGDNVSAMLNFIPQMNPEELITGYKKLLDRLYDPFLADYFERCKILVSNLAVTEHSVRRVGWRELRAMGWSLKNQLFSRQGSAYAKFLAFVLREKPRMFPEAVRLAIMGYHFQRVTRNVLAPTPG